MIELPYKQERFAQGVVKGLTQADAYRAAYRAQNMKADTIHQAASRLMADSKVTARLAELRQPVAERVDMSIHAHVSRLAKIRDAAMEAGDHGPATRAEIAIGQVAGLYVQKLEVTNTAFAGLSAAQKLEAAELVKREIGRRCVSTQLPAPDVQDVEVKGAPPGS
jgi:glucose-6-phosphate dehydrogenase assembly protein OpcA